MLPTNRYVKSGIGLKWQETFSWLMCTSIICSDVVAILRIFLVETIKYVQLFSSNDTLGGIF